MFQPRANMVCLICNRSVLRVRQRRLITRHLFEENSTLANRIRINVAPYEIIFNGNEFLCHPCWQRQMNAPGAPQNVPPTPADGAAPVPEDVVPPRPAVPPARFPPLVPEAQEQPGTVTLEYTRSPNTSDTCVFFGCNHLTRRRVPITLKKRLLFDLKHYIPPAARVCNIHLDSDDWDDINRAPNSTLSFNAEQVMDLLRMYDDAVRNKSRLNFEDMNQVDTDELHYLTGRTREEFLRIVQETPSLQNCKTPNTALAILLTKFRTGDSNERLSLMFHMSRRKLERLMKVARNALTQDFVPIHLGWDHISRDDIVRRNLALPDYLFGNPDAEPELRKAILICDGTYVYIQKSSNFLFQRDSYSLHKYTNLLKPFLFVCSDGYIVEVTGPHAATTSDAAIIQNILNEEEHPFHILFNHGDVFVLDRGFRDVINELESYGFEAHMPESLTRGETQYTTAQANKTRKITLCRWVVEVVNGRFKRDFKLFRQEYFNCAMAHMFEDFKIAAALINAFHEPISDSFYTPLFIDRINERMNLENTLGSFVNANRLNRQRVAFQSMSGELPALNDFPRLTESELIIFALGTYQLKLARSYYSEHVRNGIYNVELYRDTQQLSTALRDQGIEGSWLLRGRIQSRHTRARIYNCYILVDESERGLNAIKQYYCTCKSGMRTLGCCGHIMTIVWFLSWARYEDTISRPAEFLDSIIIDEL